MTCCYIAFSMVKVPLPFFPFRRSPRNLEPYCLHVNRLHRQKGINLRDQIIMQRIHHLRRTRDQAAHPDSRLKCRRSPFFSLVEETWSLQHGSLKQSPRQTTMQNALECGAFHLPSKICLCAIAHHRYFNWEHPCVWRCPRRVLVVYEFLDSNVCGYSKCWSFNSIFQAF